MFVRIDLCLGGDKRKKEEKIGGRGASLRKSIVFDEDRAVIFRKDRRF